MARPRTLPPLMPPPRPEMQSKELASSGSLPSPSSKIPDVLRFPLVLVLSLAVSSLLYSLVPGGMARELGSVARRFGGREYEHGYSERREWSGRGPWRNREWNEGSALALTVGWRALELGLGWFGGYDGYDLTALTVLARAPALYLLSAFYNISSTTILTSIIIDILATSIPFYLLRPISAAHSTSNASATPIANKAITTDPLIQLYTTILATCIYSVTLSLASSTYLPSTLATGFSSLTSLTAVYTTSLVSLFPFTIPLGLAIKVFIFTPSHSDPFAPPASVQPVPFNPATASLWETISWNFWGWSPRAKRVVRRTGILMATTALNTLVQCWVALDDVEAWGALVYVATWTAAAGLAGTAVGVAGAV